MVKGTHIHVQWTLLLIYVFKVAIQQHVSNYIGYSNLHKQLNIGDTKQQQVKVNSIKETTFPKAPSEKITNSFNNNVTQSFFDPFASSTCMIHQLQHNIRTKSKNIINVKHGSTIHTNGTAGAGTSSSAKLTQTEAALAGTVHLMTDKQQPKKEKQNLPLQVTKGTPTSSLAKCKESSEPRRR